MKITDTVVWESRHKIYDAVVAAEYLVQVLGIQPQSKGHVLECCLQLVVATAMRDTDIVKPESVDEALDRLAALGLGIRDRLSTMTRSKYANQLASGMILDRKAADFVDKERMSVASVPIQKKKFQALGNMPDAKYSGRRESWETDLWDEDHELYRAQQGYLALKNDPEIGPTVTENYKKAHADYCTKVAREAAERLMKRLDQERAQPQAGLSIQPLDPNSFEGMTDEEIDAEIARRNAEVAQPAPVFSNMRPPLD